MGVAATRRRSGRLGSRRRGCLVTPGRHDCRELGTESPHEPVSGRHDVGGLRTEGWRHVRGRLEPADPVPAVFRREGLLLPRLPRGVEGDLSHEEGRRRTGRHEARRHELSLRVRTRIRYRHRRSRRVHPHPHRWSAGQPADTRFPSPRRYRSRYLGTWDRRSLPGPEGPPLPLRGDDVRHNSDMVRRDTQTAAV